MSRLEERMEQLLTNSIAQLNQQMQRGFQAQADQLKEQMQLGFQAQADQLKEQMQLGFQAQADQLNQLRETQTAILRRLDVMDVPTRAALSLERAALAPAMYPIESQLSGTSATWTFIRDISSDHPVKTRYAVCAAHAAVFAPDTSPHHPQLRMPRSVAERFDGTVLIPHGRMDDATAAHLCHDVILLRLLPESDVPHLIDVNLCDPFFAESGDTTRVVGASHSVDVEGERLLQVGDARGTYFENFHHTYMFLMNRGELGNSGAVMFIRDTDRLVQGVPLQAIGTLYGTRGKDTDKHPRGIVVPTPRMDALTKLHVQPTSGGYAYAVAENEHSDICVATFGDVYFPEQTLTAASGYVNHAAAAHPKTPHPFGEQRSSGGTATAGSDSDSRPTAAESDAEVDEASN